MGAGGMGASGALAALAGAGWPAPQQLGATPHLASQVGLTSQPLCVQPDFLLPQRLQEKSRSSKQGRLQQLFFAPQLGAAPHLASQVAAAVQPLSAHLLHRCLRVRQQLDFFAQQPGSTAHFASQVAAAVQPLSAHL